MSGYTPVFETIYDGTLHGRWPTAAVWASILPLMNRDGEIRMTYEAIASRTGWPMKYLKQGIAELMQPDADSQSKIEDGRRLVAIDPGRSWGWRVVNCAKYREKARKRTHDERRQETGENAERMRDRREADQEVTEKTRRDPTCPAKSRADPLSYSNADALRGASPKRTAGTRIPEDFKPDLAYATNLLPDIDAEGEAQAFTDYWRSRVKDATKADWPATWRTWVRRCKTNGQYTRKARAAAGTHEGVRWS